MSSTARRSKRTTRCARFPPGRRCERRLRLNSKERFTTRVEDYVKYRPSYPAELIDFLGTLFHCEKPFSIADVGSGTGIFTRQLLSLKDAEVFAVEPNTAMREKAEKEFGENSRFHSVAGAAERTTLPSHSVDHITVAQAFHWFDRQRARAEFQRILKDRGIVALIWNERKETGSPFLEGYEKLIRKFSTDYLQVRHANLRATGELHAFFAGGPQIARFPNTQPFDFEGLRGRLLSSSYSPQPGSAVFPELEQRLRELFESSKVSGRVQMEYESSVYYGRL